MRLLTSWEPLLRVCEIGLVNFLAEALLNGIGELERAVETLA